MDMKSALLSFLLLVCIWSSNRADNPADYVNPFIGTTNFGTTHPGAVTPHGLMSVVPFNVMGSAENKFDKDARWWSTPYEFHNSFFTGFSHVNLSGVGCPEMGSLLLMPTTGDLTVDYREYGSPYREETASPGYYSNYLTKYDIKTEVSATPRSGIARFTFPGGKSHILLNLGEGLTNESGAMLRKVSDNEVEGVKLLGTFCYSPQSVFPIYFVMRLSKKPAQMGYWKKQRPMTGVEAEWDKDAGNYKLYTRYGKEIAGDDIGAFFSFDAQENETVEVQMGVSFVSVANARLNLDKEQSGFDFDKVKTAAREQWNSALSRIRVEGGNDNDRTVFYTALYHTMMHPNVLQDVNGEFPAMESDSVGMMSRPGNRYTVFSLWDTYRNVHQLYTLLFPARQEEMVNSMIDIYKEHGWLPKWELFGRETLTMEGDPAIPVIVDSWFRGLRNFDIHTAYEAMYKSATAPGRCNLLRPDNDHYMKHGYVPLTEPFDNSVSHALEYYIADYALSRLAADLGKKEDADLFYKRSLGYKNYYDRAFGTFRPILPDGTFYAPFDPMQGADFEPSPGFHEGNAWNYTFYVPHDVEGLTQLMGGAKPFVSKLQRVFDDNLFDMANEPDIAYPYLFAAFKGEEWRTDFQVNRLLDNYFRNSPDGLPGNDDTGTMSAWAVFSMMGFYPDCPGRSAYTLTVPQFDKITIELDSAYYSKSQLIIEKRRKNPGSNRLDKITLDGKVLKSRIVTHNDLVNGVHLIFYMKD